MPVTDVQHDLDALTLTITADFAAPVERVWEVYADPRQLERVWGPPGYPATFVDHDLVVGGRMNYYMTSPEGQRFYAYWDVTEVQQPSGFRFRDGFALDQDFTPDPDMPVAANAYDFTPTDEGTRATYVGTYATPRRCRRCSTWESSRARRRRSTRSTTWSRPRPPDLHPRRRGHPSMAELVEHASCSNGIILQRYDVVR